MLNITDAQAMYAEVMRHFLQFKVYTANNLERSNDSPLHFQNFIYIDFSEYFSFNFDHEIKSQSLKSDIL